jgi:hypothetical protein
MKSRIRAELTTQEMHLAKLLVDGWKHEPAAKEAGIGYSTAQRRMDEPQFIAYMNRLRKAADKGLVDATEEKSYELGDNWVWKDSFEAFLKMYKDKKVPAQVRLQAMKEATALLLSKHPAPGGAAQQAEAGPDVYQAEWMRKPQ